MWILRGYGWVYQSRDTDVDPQAITLLERLRLQSAF